MRALFELRLVAAFIRMVLNRRFSVRFFDFRRVRGFRYPEDVVQFRVVGLLLFLRGLVMNERTFSSALLFCDCDY